MHNSGMWLRPTAPGQVPNARQDTHLNHASLSAFIWSVADLLRGDYKQSEYGRVVLPFTVLRRLDCVLAKTKVAVLAEHGAKIRQSLYAYVQAFSPEARDIFERFDFHSQVERLAKANLLYLVTGLCHVIKAGIIHDRRRCATHAAGKSRRA